MKKLVDIPFNIWDDFWDDGYEPPGKIQETHGYIEEYDVLTEEDKEAIVEIVIAYLRTLDLTGVEVSNGGEDVNFKYLTHKRLDKLMEELESSGLQYNGLPISFYSES